MKIQGVTTNGTYPYTNGRRELVFQKDGSVTERRYTPEEVEQFIINEERPIKDRYADDKSTY